MPIIVQISCTANRFSWYSSTGPLVANGQFVAVRERSLRAWLCYGPTIQGVICMGYQKGYPILLVNLLQSSRSTFSRGSFLSSFCLPRRHIEHTNFGTEGLANSIRPLSGHSARGAIMPAARV